MFDFLEGRLEAIGPAGVVLASGGIGWRLATSARTAQGLAAGTRRRLPVHLVVSEGALALYGFADEAERAAFRRLIQIGGVGPSLALALLSAFAPAELAGLVGQRDTTALTRVKGVGRKTAERLILELGESLAELITTSAISPASQPADDLLRVLLDLGFRPLEARAAAERARRELGAGAAIEDLLRLALQQVKTA